jgi:hypothetical protein
MSQDNMTQELNRQFGLLLDFLITVSRHAGSLSQEHPSNEALKRCYEFQRSVLVCRRSLDAIQHLSISDGMRQRLECSQLVVAKMMDLVSQEIQILRRDSRPWPQK